MSFSAPGRLLRLLPVLLCCLPAVAAAQGVRLLPQQEVLRVDDAFAASLEPEAENLLRVSFVVAPGHYLYQSGFAVFLDSVEAPFELSGPSVELRDDYFGLTRVYPERANLLVRAGPTVGKLSVEFQGCARGRLCYPPTRRSFQLEKFTGGRLEPEETAQARKTPGRPF